MSRIFLCFLLMWRLNETGTSAYPLVVPQNFLMQPWPSYQPLLLRPQPILIRRYFAANQLSNDNSKDGNEKINMIDSNFIHNNHGIDVDSDSITINSNSEQDHQTKSDVMNMHQNLMHTNHIPQVNTQLEYFSNSDIVTPELGMLSGLDDAPNMQYLPQPKLSIGDFIMGISWLPIEINVPDSIAWMWNGITGIIGGIGQRIPFINRPSDEPRIPMPMTRILLPKPGFIRMKLVPINNYPISPSY